jgi:hypothetical protein
VIFIYLDSLRITYMASDLQRPWCEASCRILARDTLNRSLLHRAIRPSATVGQRLKRQQRPCGGLICWPTTRYKCALSTWNSEISLLQKFFILFLKFLCINLRRISALKTLEFAIFSFFTSSIPSDGLMVNSLACYAGDLGPKEGCSFPYYILKKRWNSLLIDVTTVLGITAVREKLLITTPPVQTLSRSWIVIN